MKVELILPKKKKKERKNNWLANRLYVLAHNIAICVVLFLLGFKSLIMNKVSLQIRLEINFLNFSYISFFFVNFENLIIEFHVSYILNMHIKFHSNRMLFTFWPINLFFIHNFRSQTLKILTFIWWHNNLFFIF